MAATHCLFQVETHLRPFVADPSISVCIKALFLLQHFRKFSRVVSIDKNAFQDFCQTPEREACHRDKRAEDKAKI